MTTQTQPAQANANKEDDKPTRSGLPRDWVLPSNIQLSTSIKFCDMRMEMKDYAIQLTQFIYVQMVRSHFPYLKDAAEHIKKGFEGEFGGGWNVVCGVNFGSYFNYEAKACILIYHNHVGFLIWKFG